MVALNSSALQIHKRCVVQDETPSPEPGRDSAERIGSGVEIRNFYSKRPRGACNVSQITRGDQTNPRSHISVCATQRTHITQAIA